MCTSCNQIIPSKYKNAHERGTNHKNNTYITLENGVLLRNSAFKSRIASYKILTQREHVDLETFMMELKEKTINLIRTNVKKFTLVKVNVELFGLYTIPEKNIFDIKSFNTKNKVITLSTNVEEVLRDFQEVIKQKMADFLECDSGKIIIIFIILYSYMVLYFRLDFS